MRRATARGRLPLAWLLVAIGCGDPPAPVDAPRPAATVSPAFRAEAHTAAFERLLPLGRTALELADPIAAATLGRAAPGPMPLGVGRRAALREAVDAAWREAAEIDAAALSPDRAAVLAALRFALLRARDDVTRRPLTRTDPAIAIEATARLLDLLEVRVRSGAADDVTAILAAARSELVAGLDDLGACTPAMATAAAHDAAALAVRVERLGARLGGGAPVLAVALREAATRLSDLAARLPEARGVAWGEPVAPARTGEPTLRLPPRIGGAALVRMLDVEESIAGELAPRVDALVRTAAALSTMRGPDRPAPPARAVDTARCLAAWTPLAGFAAAQPALAASAGFDCERDLDRLPASADDAALALTLIDLGLVAPAERARRAAVVPELALVGGRIAPASHRMLQAMAIAVGVGDADLRRAAIGRARDATCLAAVALWIHAGLGDDAALATAVGEGCGPDPIATWIARAEARPRASLDGLGLEIAGLGPAEAVALDAFWWVPLGLVDVLAVPPAPAAPPPKATVEPLAPAPGGATEAP